MMSVTNTTTQLPAWQGHKHADSMDSEISYFEASSTSTNDSWSGYFDGWEGPAQDSYCPQIASASSSPTRAKESDDMQLCEPETLPPVCTYRRRSESMGRQAELNHPVKAISKTKRYGIAPYSDPHAGDEALNRLNSLLLDSMAGTEDILAAMYSADWDVTSLQKWYQQSARGPADLALFKIMFTLRYTLDEPSPLS